TEDPDEHLLGQVLGVVPITCQAVGEPVHAVGVGADDLLPRWRDPRAIRGQLFHHGTTSPRPYQRPLASPLITVAAGATLASLSFFTTRRPLSLVVIPVSALFYGWS